MPRYLVSGMVQGVGFRRFVQRHAQELGLRGWVANRPDGVVEVRADGEPGKLTELERLLQQGPRFANVTKVEVSENSDSMHLPTPFSIDG